MSSYLLGNIIGRFIASAFLVWLVLLVINRFSFSTSVKKLIKPLPLIAVLLLFFLGLASNAIAASNSDTTTEATNNDKQLFYVTTFPELGIEEIYIPAEPAWRFDTHLENQIKRLTLQSQSVDDVAALIEISQHPFTVQPHQYPVVTQGIVDSLSSQLNARFDKLTTDTNHPLDPVSFQAATTHQGSLLEYRLDVFLHNNRVWTFTSVADLTDQTPFQILRAKVFNSLRLRKAS